MVPDRGRERGAWYQGLLGAARDADLVFVDPDNGIEVPSKPVGRKDSSKYVTWQEIQGLWKMGCSIPCGPDQDQRSVIDQRRQPTD